MKTFLTFGRPEMGENEIRKIQALSHQKAAKLTAIAIVECMKELHGDEGEALFDRDIYIDIVVDKELCAETNFMFSTSELVTQGCR